MLVPPGQNIPESQGVCLEVDGQYEPTAQGVSVVDPARQYDPDEQSVASVPFGQKYSGGHCTGSARFLDPPRSTLPWHTVPGGQRTVVFGDGQYMPSGHDCRSVVPAGQYQPTSHSIMPLSEQMLPA